MSAPASTPSEQHPAPAPPLEITVPIITTGSQDIISSESVLQSSLKLDDGDDGHDGPPLPPALPPRPPPRPRQSQGGAAGAAALAQLASADQLEEFAPGLQQQIRVRGKRLHVSVPYRIPRPVTETNHLLICATGAKCQRQRQETGKLLSPN
jgi:hypothetical protein